MLNMIVTFYSMKPWKNTTVMITPSFRFITCYANQLNHFSCESFFVKIILEPFSLEMDLSCCCIS